MRNPFRKKQARQNLPASSFRVQGTDIEVGIWRNEYDQNKVKYRFKLSRVGENGRRFTALGAEDVMRLPAVTLALCKVFSMSKIDEDVRARLISLQETLEDMEMLRKGSAGELLHDSRGSRCGETLV